MTSTLRDTGENVHVLPTGQDGHEEALTCLCLPRVEWIVGKDGVKRAVVVHNRFGEN